MKVMHEAGLLTSAKKVLHGTRVQNKPQREQEVLAMSEVLKGVDSVH